MAVVEHGIVQRQKDAVEGIGWIHAVTPFADAPVICRHAGFRIRLLRARGKAGPRRRTGSPAPTHMECPISRRDKVSEVGLGHSLRVGSAQSLATAGASLVEMQVAGRWQSPNMPGYYAQGQLARQGAVAKLRYGMS